MKPIAYSQTRITKSDFSQQVLILEQSKNLVVIPRKISKGSVILTKSKQNRVNHRRKNWIHDLWLGLRIWLQFNRVKTSTNVILELHILLFEFLS